MSLFISRFHSEKHSALVGDYSTDFVADNDEHNIQWYSLSPESKEWHWETDLTNAHFGDKKLFSHDFKWVRVNAGYAGIGLTSDDFDKASLELRQIDRENTVCDDRKCLTKNACSEWKGKVPDVKMTLSNKEQYTIKGDDLLHEKSIVDETGEY